MYSAFYRTMAFISIVLWSISCSKSEVTANYKNERDFPSTGTTQTGDGTDKGTAADGADIKAQALAILQKSCVKCHGGGAASGGFGIIDDVDAMVASNKYIIPGNPDGSAIYKRLGLAKTMPPAGPLATADADIIKQWIQGL